MTPDDLKQLDDEQIQQLRRDVAADIERRDALDTIPATVADLATKYREGGGDPDDLRAVID